LTLSLALFKEDIALSFCHLDLGMLVKRLTGHSFLNWYLTPRSFHYSLCARCILSWGRALGPFGGLSTGQLMLPAPHGREERK